MRSNCSVLLAFVAIFPAMSQTAPQRSNELCTSLSAVASERALRFTPFKPGACAIDIDTGYTLFVNYDHRLLHVSLGVNAAILNGDASAIWLRLSTFDNLAHVAIGTEQQSIFDEIQIAL